VRLLTNEKITLGSWDGITTKITAAVFSFGPQNQVGFDLSVAPQNRREDATAWDTHRDLAACIAWKQVELGFSCLA
jgi:hypothetical protein